MRPDDPGARSAELYEKITRKRARRAHKMKLAERLAKLPRAKFSVFGDDQATDEFVRAATLRNVINDHVATTFNARLVNELAHIEHEQPDLLRDRATAICLSDRERSKVLADAMRNSGCRVEILEPPARIDDLLGPIPRVPMHDGRLTDEGGNGEDHDPPSPRASAIAQAEASIERRPGAREPTPRPDKTEDLFAHSFWATEAKPTTALPYVVKGIFGKGDVVVFWGPPGSGKSFNAIELAMAVGSGKPWRGRRTKRGIVVYIAAESTRARLENRIAALRQEWAAAAQAQVLIVPLALDLLRAERGDVDRVIGTVRRIEDKRADVALIVIDTLAVTFAGGNENAPEDMGLYVANILRIRADTGAAVLIVHHSGKDEARGMRGHSALLGAIDAELVIESPEGGPQILRTGKVRDGDGFSDLFAFTLRRIELGLDPDGDAVTTCVVDGMDDAATKLARRQRKGAGLGKHQRAVLRVLEKAGGRMPRLDLAHKLKDEGVQRNRANDAIASLLQTGMLVPHNDVNPPEVSLR